MSRPLRIEYPGAWYHVMNRGRRGEEIFSTSKDYEVFLGVLREAVEMWNVKIAAYCLMTNHYHLLIHTPDGNLSRAMRHINGVYTQRFNRRYKKDGQLFRGRYKAVVVGGDSYLLEVLRYIHRNPLKAGLVKNLDDFLWSSHKGYSSLAKNWDWLHKDFMLSLFSEKSGLAQKAYREFVGQEEPEEMERFYGKKNLSSLLGDKAFKEWVKEKFEKLRFHEEMPESRLLAPDPERIMAAVSKSFKTKKEMLLKSRRGKENVPRDTAIYLFRVYSRETLTGVGKRFNIDKYSTVSSIIERIKNRKTKDKTFAKQLDRIEKAILKGQRKI